MEASTVALAEHVASLEDPRVERTKLHPLLSVIVIALCAIICGAESWNDIAAFGEAKQEWFATFLELPHGIPSHDTFNRVFGALDPVQFQACFARWMQAVASVLPTQVIALDGKTVRRSHDAPTGTAAIHMVSAWATANRLILAQVKVDAKSNEITALPEVLRQLAITGCIVTIDAMGCQREIAQQILNQGGHYVLATESGFADVLHTQTRTVTKGHGRLEIRRH